MPDNDCRIRLRLPSGAEMEVQGPGEFVRGETRQLLGHLEAPAEPGRPSAAGRTAAAPAPALEWTSLVEARGSDLIVRAKLEDGPLEAALVLIASSDKLLGQPRPNATQLAKWIRSSGYAVERIDRMLAAAVRSGDILASGAKRARRYELSANGRTKALQAAQKLSGLISKGS